MKGLTWKQRCINFLEHYGYQKEEHVTRKYVVYFKSGQHETHWYFIGSNGAVRGNKTGKVSETYSVTDAFHKQVVLFEQRQVKGMDNE